MPVIKLFEGLNAKYSKLKARAEELAKELSSIEIEMNECRTDDGEKNLLLLFGRELPKEIINLIFEFDPTKREAFNRCLNQMLKGCYDARAPTHHYLSIKSASKRMAQMVDGLYLGHINMGQSVHMDGRYIKSVFNFDTDDESRMSPRFNYTKNIYTWEYHSNRRDWRIRAHHFSGERRYYDYGLPEGYRQARLRKNLPLYADKARYTIYYCSREKANLVSKISKNIKKWERRNPELCNY